MKCRKQIALGMSALMLLSCLTGCAVHAATATEEQTQITEAADALLGTHSNSSGKEETVYVIAEPDGTPTETIVSAWLKNPDGAETITDRADLKDIENVDGDQTYSEAADGSLIWNAGGSDIRYRGRTDKALPVTTHISYVLDVVQLAPEDLAGKSGHLTITFSYDNNTAERRTVDGQEVTLYQPFTVISGLMLDSKKAENVTATRGKVISTGDRTIAVGMAMPGLRESLALDSQEDPILEMDIPEQVVIEADVNDFELLTTVTVIENNLLDDLNLDAGEQELSDAIKKLTDASGALTGGTDELWTGAKVLSDGANTLQTGLGTLADGAQALCDGSEQLSSGAKQVASGAQALADGTDVLAQGSKTLESGAKQVDKGSGALLGGAGRVADGAQQLSDGAHAVHSGAKEAAVRPRHPLRRSKGSA